eukprot:5499294-Heterocapsa_arctica.AAC.1
MGALLGSALLDLLRWLVRLPRPGPPFPRSFAQSVAHPALSLSLSKPSLSMRRLRSARALTA